MDSNFSTKIALLSRLLDRISNLLNNTGNLIKDEFKISETIEYNNNNFRVSKSINRLEKAFVSMGTSLYITEMLAIKSRECLDSLSSVIFSLIIEEKVFTRRIIAFVPLVSIATMRFNRLIITETERDKYVKIENLRQKRREALRQSVERMISGRKLVNRPYDKFNIAEHIKTIEGSHSNKLVVPALCRSPYKRVSLNDGLPTLKPISRLTYGTNHIIRY